MRNLLRPSLGFPTTIPLAALLSIAPLIANGQFTTPNVINIPGNVTNSLGHTRVINRGLVAVAHISASTVDSFGETFGSISGMQITGWTNLGNGHYSGVLNVLPDRGYNSGNFYSDYAARINQVGFDFLQYTGSTNIGGVTDLEKLAAQNQVVFTTPITGAKFTYDDPITLSNSVTTGLDAASTVSLFGQTLPYVATYSGFATPTSTTNNTFAGINKLALDSEALVIKPDGSGYVGDEYEANVYYFDAAKKIIGAIVPPAAFQPNSPSNSPNFSSALTPVNGRRNNQGFEGVALSPDGTRLFALLQSSTIQDSDGSAQNRKQTRLLIYDVSSNPTNNVVLAEYALTLPTYRTTGNGAAVNATAAQSEIVALDNTRILVLSRDGNGLGSVAISPNVYKSILLVDTSVGTPTNFAADAAKNAQGGKIVTTPGVLDPAITPLAWTEVVNLLNTNQLAKFNVQFDTGTGQVTKLTLGEKWEGLALVPAHDTNAPNDFFLFVGNDNDFVTSAGIMRGPGGTNVTYNAFNGYPANRIPAPVDSANNENDTRILVFRVTIASALLFPQSVASGDPTPDSVVLWTRAVSASPTTNDLVVGVQVADNTAFTNIVFQRNDLVSSPAHDNCVKVRATGLSPYTTYYYRFVGLENNYSPVGRTRTAPAANQQVPIRFAVLNCQDYIGRYYNTLAQLAQSESNKCDFVVHLGDYIYETAGNPSFQSTGAVRSITFNDLAGARQLGSTNSPFYAAASLDNYRQLYRTYRTDANLQRVHELFPMINIWDDHEYANDCWGANSTDYSGKTNELNLARRQNAEQAFFEYLPIAVGLDSQGISLTSADLYPNARIYRDFKFGTLLQLFLTDYRSYRPDHLVAEDAFPGTVPMDETTCSNFLGLAWNVVRTSFDPYVNIDDPTNAVLKATLQAVATGAYQAEGLTLSQAQARALAAVVGNLSSTYINGLLVGASLPPAFMPSQQAAMPRGLSFLLIGKQSLFSSFGSRYLVPRDTFTLYAAYRAFLNAASQDVYGTAQATALATALTTNGARWKVVGDSVSFAPLGFDFANPPVPLPTNFPAQLRVQLQLNADDWDGFPNGRQAVLNTLGAFGAVVISGDIHGSFITRHNASGGRIVPEFTATSVSSESFRAELSSEAKSNPTTQNLPGLDDLIAATDLLLKDSVIKTGLGTIIDTRTDANGYLVMEATADNLYADYYHIPAQYVTNDFTANPATLNTITDTKRYTVFQGTNGLSLFEVPKISSVSTTTNLNLSWPAANVGWRLEIQTNALNLGISTNWATWSGSPDTNAVSIPVNPANPSVFFRLVYP